MTYGGLAMEKKKIVVLHRSLVMGGEERVTINLLNALDYSRVEVTLWLLERGGVLEKNLNENVTVRTLDYSEYFPENDLRRLLKCRLKRLQFSEVLRILYYKSRVIISKNPGERELLKMKAYGPVDRNTYDLLILNHSYRQELLYWALGRFRAKKRAFWVHGKDYLSPEPDLRRYAYGKYDRVFPVSKGVMDYFLGLYPELKDRAEVFYNIQNIEDIKARSMEPCDTETEQPAIVTVGRLSPEKGMDLIPETMSLLLKKGISAIWYVVGGGPEYERLQSLSKSLDVEKNVRFLGEKTNPYPYMRVAAVYVQPSRSEGFCTTTIEAKIIGKPVVATDVNGMREQFEDGVTGIIVPIESPEALCEAVSDLLEHPEKRQGIIDNIAREGALVSNDLSGLYTLLNL